MKTITKRADQLQPGDIIVMNGYRHRVVIEATSYDTETSIHYASSPYAYGDLLNLVNDDNHRRFEVLTRLSPAQELADEMHTILQMVVANKADWRAAADALLDKLHPEPPTAEELAAALSNLAERPVRERIEESFETAKALLNRARRAGMIK